MEIYKFYQDSFSKEELAEIRALRGFSGLKIMYEENAQGTKGMGKV